MLKSGTGEGVLDCREVDALLGAYLEGGLSPDRAAEVDAHLDGCFDCRRAARQDAEVASRLRVEAAWERKQLSSRAAARIQEQAYRRMRRSLRVQRFHRAAWAAIALVVLGLIALGGYAWWQQRPVALNQPTARPSRTPSLRIVGLEPTIDTAARTATPPVPTTTPTLRAYQAQPEHLPTSYPSLPIPDEPADTPAPGPTATVHSGPTPVPTQKLPEILSTGVLDCTPLDGYSRCVDPILGIEFEYPSRWGEIEAVLRDGGYAGYAYDYYFAGKRYGDTYPLGAGGRSADFSEGRGGMPTDFAGYGDLGLQSKPEACDTRWADSLPICEQVTTDVAWMIRFPNARLICEGEPGLYKLPVFRVEIDLPDNPTINGFVFEAPFVSEQFANRIEKDLYPLLWVSSDTIPRQCDQESQQAYDAQLAVLLEELTTRSADDETVGKLDELIHLATSVSPLEGAAVPIDSTSTFLEARQALLALELPGR